MDIRAIEARDYLKNKFELLKEIHNDYIDVGTPAYTDKKRIRLCFFVKLNNGKRRCTQYSRLLLEIKLGRKLENNETVDHIDGDITNDAVDNLQLLTRSDNAKKGPSEENKKIQFENLSKMRKGIPFYHGRGENNGYHKLSNNQVSEIKELQKNHYRGQDLYIANQFGVSRELISQIRRGKVRLTG